MKKFLSLTFALSLLCAFTLTTNAQTKRRPIKRTTASKTASNEPVAPRLVVGTEMKIRLQNEIDTKNAADGDKFTAKVLDPSAHADATIEGHVAKVNQSGKFKGRTSLVLSFDRISYSNGASRAI
ncbi:MAG: hypothetical protein HOP19_15620, partial [Acidobacteria bacterium]|nr:hypothetical protein [Acidobacteriota bacterium]